MTIKSRTLAEINEEALKLLYGNLGVADTIRFINQYTNGSGDYTKEREAYLNDVTLESIFEEAQKLEDKG